MQKDSHFVFSQEITYRHHGGDTHPLNSTFHVFCNVFPMDMIRCQCNNCGLQFVLVQKIQNAQLYEC